MAEHATHPALEPPPVEILTVPEVAAKLRISETSVYRLIGDGHLNAVNAGARRRVVSDEELDRFIRTGGVHAPSTEAPSDLPFSVDGAA
jgi:excisionase family DNA binding protein